MVINCLNFIASNQPVAVPDEVPGSLAPLCRLLALQGASDGHVHGCEGYWQGCHGYANRNLAEKLSGIIRKSLLKMGIMMRQ